jgi:oxygen-independent coproporphyrinogen-3 oxidase
VNLSELRAEFGSPALRALDSILTGLECDGLIAWTDDRVALTPRGRLVSNEVFERFLAVTAA